MPQSYFFPRQTGEKRGKTFESETISHSDPVQWSCSRQGCFRCKWMCNGIGVCHLWKMKQIAVVGSDFNVHIWWLWWRRCNRQSSDLKWSFCGFEKRQCLPDAAAQLSVWFIFKNYKTFLSFGQFPMIWENSYTLDVLESTMETALFIYKLFRTKMDLEILVYWGFHFWLQQNKQLRFYCLEAMKL